MVDSINNTLRPEGCFKREGKIIRLYNQQCGKCFYCQKDMQLFRNTRRFPLPDNFATKDHVLPKSLGWTGEIENLVAACAKCNSNRSSIAINEYKAMIAEGRV